MKIDSQYRRFFHSDRLSTTKYNQLRDFATYYIDVKNELSENFNSNLEHCLRASQYDYQKECRNFLKDRISSHFYIQITDDIYFSYQRKLKTIQDKMDFCVISDIKITHYKKDTAKHKKGQIKEITSKKKSTKLAQTLSYLAKYGDENILTWLTQKFLDEADPKKEKQYAKTLDHIYKYGFGRLMATAHSKRNRVLSYYFKDPIVFKQLTIRGRSRLTLPILSYNKNKKSEIKAFINISWHKRASRFKIPVKYSNDFHGDMRKYYKKGNTEYVIKIYDDNRVAIILSHKGKREIPHNKTNYVGIDANTKTNLLTCSNGSSIDFDRRTISKTCKILKKSDELKARNPNYYIGKRKQRILTHLRNEFKSKIRHSLSDLCKEFKSQGIDHAIFENLSCSFGISHSKTEDGLNQNRLMKELGVASIKNEFEHVARKHDISTSLVQPEYTSQTCSKCGCVDSENREKQETFKCIACGYECNADYNASLNIRDRVASTVLRSKLLKENEIRNGSFKPNSIQGKGIKEVLLELYKPPCENNEKDLF